MCRARVMFRTRSPCVGGRGCTKAVVTDPKGYLAMLKRVLAVTAVGSLAVFGMTAVPSAAATKHKGPNVNLKVKKGGGVGFKPSVLDATVAPGKSCGKTNYEYSITN